MPAAVQLNMTKEKDKTMINGLTLNSRQLISSGLLMLTGNCISTSIFSHSISKLFRTWNLQYLFPHPCFLLDDLVPPPQLLILLRKQEQPEEKSCKPPPHLVTDLHPCLYNPPSLLVLGMQHPHSQLTPTPLPVPCMPAPPGCSKTCSSNCPLFPEPSSSLLYWIFLINTVTYCLFSYLKNLFLTIYLFLLTTT